MKIIDAFTFCNELDILEIRLNYLDPYVDYFLLVESIKSQTLLNKPLFFEENRKRFEKFSNKIVQVIVDEFPKLQEGTWQMENFQRNSIVNGLKLLLNHSMVTDEDIIMVSDVDEIPDGERLKLCLSDIEGQISFKMTYNPFYVNLTTKDKTWVGTTAIKLEEAIKQNISPQDLRNRKDYVNIIENCGWHFGNQGGKDALFKKFYNCIEPLDKSLIYDYQNFSKEYDRKIKRGGSFLFSDKIDDSIKLIEYDENLLPEYLVQNKEKYKHLFLE